jgi:uncharacterized protein YhaN
MIGASTALYAASMAGVTAIQSSADRTLILRQTPAEEAAERLRDGHARLESQIDQAAAAYSRAVGAYDALTPRLGDMEDSLERLTGQVKTVSGAAKALPARISLPPVKRTVVRTVTVPRPKVSTSTGASGK